MATLLALRMQEARGSHPNGFDAQLLRKQNYGLIGLANKGKNGLLVGQTRQQLESSNFWGAPANKIPVYDPMGGAVVNTAMTCTFPTNESEARYITATWLSAHYGFKINRRLVEQNGAGITLASEFARLAFETENKLALNLEGQIGTVLDAAKATTTNSTLVGVGSQYGALVGDAIQVSLANRPRFYGDIDAIFAADNFMPQMGLDFIGSAAYLADVNYYINQGAGNSSNTSYQFGSKEFMFSNTVATTALARSTAYACTPNSLGFYTKLAPEYENGWSVRSSGIEYGKWASSLLGIDLAVMSSDNCSDVSGATGNSLDLEGPTEFYQMGYTVCILTAQKGPTETNNGIKKIDFLNV